MPILYREEVNTEDKIRSFFFLDDAPFDPNIVQYTIFTPECNPVKHQTEKDALQFALGHFYADWTVDAGAAVGEYKIIWIFRKDSNGQLCTKADCFNIVRNLSEACEAIHIPSGHGGGPGGQEQSGTCNCPPFGNFIRDHFGRIINL